MRALLTMMVLLLGTGSLRAERYLTVAEAQKLAFPSADKFEEALLRLSPEQAKKIQRETGTPVRNTANKVYYCYQGTELAGVLFIDHVLGKHEFIDYAVALTPEGRVISVEILEYRESYGGEIRGSKWRKQFVGKGSKAPLRLNDDIYNISGATLSCRHVTDGVKRVLATFDLLCRPQLVARRVPNQSSAAN